MKRRLILIMSIIFLLAVGISCYFFALECQNKQESGKEEKVNPAYAERGLKNLAIGMRTYSALNGGGGVTMFTGDVSRIEQYVMQAAFQALPGKHQVPYNGYVFELMENPLGDNFKNNFMFVARPASGFAGESFQIDKFEHVTTYNNP